jgi:hypothetical protein
MTISHEKQGSRKQTQPKRRTNNWHVQIEEESFISTKGGKIIYFEMKF